MMPTAAATAASNRTPPAAEKPPAAADRHGPAAASFEKLLATPNRSPGELREALRALRRLILLEGLPDEPPPSMSSPYTVCTLRGRVWKCLLGVHHLSASEYTGLLGKGPSTVYDKIRNDTFRTYATDKLFTARVDEKMLSRVLNAFAWRAQDFPAALHAPDLRFSYVQGMNVLAAPFLYCMPELDAFFAFSMFLRDICPLYVQPALQGVHCALKLVDRCLKVVDPKLYSYLHKKNLTAELYAFPSLLTFCANTPPLDEVLKLWDFLLAYGVHLNVLCVIAQLLLMRDQLMQAPSPMKLVRKLPQLNAAAIIGLAVSMVPKLPERLYEHLLRHPFDPAVAEQLNNGRPGGGAGPGGHPAAPKPESAAALASETES